jgi:hypothetical protein
VVDGNSIKGNRIVPGITIAIILLLAVFAFRTGFSILSPTGLVSLENTTMTGSFDISKTDTAVSADHTTVKFSAPEGAKITTKTDEINSSGSFSITDFVGTIRWDTENIILEGDMESLAGNQLSIKFTNRESATITMKAGSIEALTVNMSSFSEKLTGSIRLENRFTLKLNQTPVDIGDYSGTVHIQRVNNVTTMMLNGRSDTAKVTQENILKNIA